MNQEEFTSRVDRNRSKLFRIAGRMIRKSDCEDAVQSTILSAWEHLPDLKDENAFDAWIRQIMVNRCRQIQRGYKKEKDIYAALQERQQVSDFDETVLGEAMDALNEDERRLICLHHQQGYSIREISAVMDKSEDVLKMRLYRARKHLRTILIALLLLILMACVAVGTGMIDVDWFLQNRRAEPAVIGKPIPAQSISVEYAGKLLDISVSDAVWDEDALSVSFVYSIVGKDVLTVHSGNIGVDGVRQDHIWTDRGVVPVQEWADGSRVHTFYVDSWHLGGLYLTGSEDYLPDGLGETFMTELHLDWIAPDRYESLLDDNGMLAFEAKLMLEDYESGEIMEEQNAVVRIGAPTPQEWRGMYEAHDR